MIDDNWDMVTGNTGHDIEVLNYSNQVNVIEALVLLMMHHYATPEGSCSHPPGEKILKEFHRTATLFLLEAPGEFRTSEVVVRRGDGVVIHTPPEVPAMQGHVDTFFYNLLSQWSSKDPAEIGAYALWLINWIHPFKNGNGRTARAFCYACICLRYGFILPGKKTIIDMIMQNRAEYQVALKAADESYGAVGTPNLHLMTDFLDRLIADQFNSIDNDINPQS